MGYCKTEFFRFVVRLAACCFRLPQRAWHGPCLRGTLRAGGLPYRPVRRPPARWISDDIDGVFRADVAHVVWLITNVCGRGAEMLLLAAMLDDK